MQRNLNEQGRKQAADIGHALKRLQIPIGKIISSPYCRCIDTAKEMFGTRQFDVSDNLVFLVGLKGKDKKAIIKYLKMLLGEKPSRGEIRSL